MTQLICLRHAEAENNVRQTMAPSLTAPLTPRGRDQAAAAAEQLRHRSAVRVYCSAAARAIETATIIAAVCGVEVVSLAGLDEVEIGPEADPHDEQTNAAAREALRSWVVDQSLEVAFVGGETGSSVVRRTTGALRTIVSDHPDETVVVVGHVASLTTGLSVLCGLHAELWGRPLPHAVPFAVEAGKAWTCREWPGQIVGGHS